MPARSALGAARRQRRGDDDHLGGLASVCVPRDARSRGILPVAAALAIILAIFAAIAAPDWFARSKDGLDSPALPEDLLGLLTLIVVPVQLLLVIVAMIGFNQHVEEERPIGGRPCTARVTSGAAPAPPDRRGPG